jgi:branched-chain amino acid transport system ATP-binding protein
VRTSRGQIEGARPVSIKSTAFQPMSTIPILRTVGLRKTFGGVAAVDGVDFTLAEGELRCVIGPNGAGKSTFFKLLSGQLQPSNGQILFRGQDTTGEERFRIARRGVAIKTQVPSVYDGFPVVENIRLAAARKQTPDATRQIVGDVLARIGMTSHAHRLVGELAHGQRQWVELGMLLAADPVLILLDEPTAGLTKNEIGRMAELVRDMRSKQSVIVVEHDMAFVQMLGGTVTVFHQGRILVEDTMDNIRRNTQVRDVYLGKRSHAGA